MEGCNAFLRPAVTSCPGFLTSNMAALAIERRTEIIERLQTGERVSEIAASFGITGPAITQYLSHDPEYQAAREYGTEQRLDQAEDAIDRAEDALSLARARDSWRAKSWRASVEHSHRWGVKPSVSVNIGVNGTLSDAELMRIAAPLLGVSEATGVMSNTIDADSASVLDVEPKAK